MMFLCLFLLSAAIAAVSGDSMRTCEVIEIEYCKDIGYNYTGMPNFFRHESQEEAQQNYQTFAPLIRYGCSPQLIFFLCSVYVPMCTDKVPIPIGPCRPLCESVRSKCEPTLRDFGFSWPDQLNCTIFPKENNGSDMCMDGPSADDPTHIQAIPSTSRKSTKRVASRKPFKPYGNQCSQYRYADRYMFVNASQRCGQVCNRDVLFTEENKHFTSIWLALWTFACFMTSAFTTLLYMIDTSQYESPDKAVVYLCVCYCFQSVGYFIRLLVGREAASCYSEGSTSVLVHQGLQNYYCTAIFVFIYYFTNAATMWWVVVTISWFMYLPLQYTAQQIRRSMKVLQTVAWAFPALMTCTILVMKAVDAEELTGVCGVGNQNRDTLLAFVIIPHIACLAIGGAFLITGGIKLFQNRENKRYMNIVPTSASRSWMFASLYLIPASGVLGVQFYEYLNRDSWTLNQNGPITRPYFEYFSFKIFMSVIVGVTAGLWTWCSKTSKLNEPATKPGAAPPLLVSTPFQHRPIMVPNQYFVPQHLLTQMQQQQAHGYQQHMQHMDTLTPRNTVL